MTDQPGLFDPRLPEAGRDYAPVGRRHPDTSRAAARALPRTGSKRRRTLHIIEERGGVTCDEVEWLTGWTHQSASPIFTGLRADGWIEDSGDRREVRASGNAAIVWTLTEEGRRELTDAG